MIPNDSERACAWNILVQAQKREVYDEENFRDGFSALACRQAHGNKRKRDVVPAPPIMDF